MRNTLSRRAFLKTAALAGAAAVLAACGPAEPAVAPGLRRLRLLHTNDEHGFLEMEEGTAGAAGIMQRWRADEGYQPDDGGWLLVSSGDLWTGPALSTVTRGKAAIDWMNAAGYRAAAIGNHDFDYGLEELSERAGEANFPFLSANIRRRDGGQPGFCRSYVVLEHQGIQVGLIGLTTIETPVDTRPEPLADLLIGPYEPAVRAAAAEARAAGASVLLLLGHICASEQRTLAPLAAELGIAVIFGGHCHEEVTETADGVLLVQSNSYLRGYSRVFLDLDAAGQVAQASAEYIANPPARIAALTGQDTATLGQIAAWRAQTDPALWETVGHCARKIDRDSAQMAHLFYLAWHSAYPQAQVTLAAPRYVQSLPAGPLSRASIVSMLPTENTLLAMQLSGEQLLEVLSQRQPIAGGLSEGPNGYRLADGTPLDPATRYTVLLPDVLYLGGNYYEVSRYDPAPVATGIHWQRAIADWLASQGTSPSRPLDELLQGVA